MSVKFSNPLWTAELWQKQQKKTTVPEQKIDAVRAIVCALLLELSHNSLASHWVTKQA